MSILTEYLTIAMKINDVVDIPDIQQTFFPTLTDHTDKPSEFAVIVLQDGSTGLTYLNLDDSLKTEDRQCLIDIEGHNPLVLAREFASYDGWRSAVAWGALNAIGQFFLRRINYPFDFSSDSLGSLDLQEGDRLGMVGYFPPLVKLVREMDIPLTVIERKSEFVQTDNNFTVTLDTSKLAGFNKVLCTSTTVINSSISNILDNCRNADKIAVIGPTAGFLPDPLFSRGVDIVGCTVVHNPDTFIQRCRNNVHWGDATTKYCISRNDYPGFDSLLHSLE